MRAPEWAVDCFGGGRCARYMATALGNSRYPFTANNRTAKLGPVSVSRTAACRSREDQDRRIHDIYLNALGRHGVRCEITESTGQEGPENLA